MFLTYPQMIFFSSQGVLQPGKICTQEWSKLH